MFEMKSDGTFFVLICKNC